MGSSRDPVNSRERSSAAGRRRDRDKDRDRGRDRDRRPPPLSTGGSDHYGSRHRSSPPSCIHVARLAYTLTFISPTYSSALFVNLNRGTYQNGHDMGDHLGSDEYADDYDDDYRV